MNQMRFSTLDFEDNTKVSKETKFIYVPITAASREERVYQVRLTDLELQDKYY